jgi:hypothetical protein
MSGTMDEDETCKTALEEDRAIAYLRGELSPSATVDFEVHLLGCAACASVVQKLELHLEAAHELRGIRWDRVTIEERSPYYAGSTEGKKSSPDADKDRVSPYMSLRPRRLPETIDEDAEWVSPTDESPTKDSVPSQKKRGKKR